MGEFGAKDVNLKMSRGLIFRRSPDGQSLNLVDNKWLRRFSRCVCPKNSFRFYEIKWRDIPLSVEKLPGRVSIRELPTVIYSHIFLHLFSYIGIFDEMIKNRHDIVSAIKNDITAIRLFYFLYFPNNHIMESMSTLFFGMNWREISCFHINL